MRQTTLDEQCDRLRHIERLTASLERWRGGELDRILPDEYRYWCDVLAHLQAGGDYAIRRASPEQYFRTGSTGAPGVDAMFQGAGRALAGISRATINYMRYTRREK